MSSIVSLPSVSEVGLRKRCNRRTREDFPLWREVSITESRRLNCDWFCLVAHLPVLPQTAIFSPGDIESDISRRINGFGSALELCPPSTGASKTRW